MSDTPEQDRPEDGSAGRPPYPGWSAEQPPEQGWTAPGQQPAGQPPAGAPPAGQQPPGRSGWQSPGSGWAEQPGQASGGAGPGWAQPGAQPGTQPGQHPYPPPGAPPPGALPGQPTGWGTPAWTPPPTVKPGVIPLRPLGVGEILDGAVTTIRRNPRPMLGLSAVVAVVVQLVGFVVSLIIFRDLQSLETLEPTATPAELFSAMAGMFGGIGVLAVVSWVATVILTGILTIVVSRAVLGHNLTAGEAWAAARPKLPKLLLLTLLYPLIVASPVLVVVALTTLAMAAGAGDGAIAIGVLAGFAAFGVTVWLYARYALAAPALMLESTPGRHHGEPSRPIGLGRALRRSAELVTKSWWRVFGILVLVAIVAGIVAQVISLLFSVPTFFFADPFDPESMGNLGVLALSALGGIVSTTITAPFLAAASALLYIDRRIRREALDVELARAAGVTIPGRTDQPPPMR